MRSILLSTLLSRELHGIYRLSSSHSPYISNTLFLRLAFDRLRLKCLNSDFSRLKVKKSILDKLLIEPQVQEYFHYISNEYEKYENSEVCQTSVTNFLREIKVKGNHLKDLSDLSTGNDKEMSELVKDEEEKYRKEIEHIYSKILLLALPEDETDYKNATIQISPGVGGIEAQLFTREIFEMYLKYAKFRNWKSVYIEKSESDGGGLYKGEANICGESVFGFLKHEAGIHRVQRIPITEKAGRLQTSTCKINVIPEVDDTDIILKPSEIKIEVKYSSGPGGQNVNKSETCVRITHIPTGYVVECQEERSQSENKKRALKKLRNYLYQEEQKKVALRIDDLKRKQAATILRSDKIRTYNFAQNRITDHRINFTVHNTKQFMEGSDLLHEMILELDINHKKECILKNIARILQDKNVDEIFKK